MGLWLEGVPEGCAGGGMAESHGQAANCIQEPEDVLGGHTESTLP